ncbi:MAG: hypothetical protein ACKVS5_16720 [Parvularculaceae bacterium]
MHRPSLIVSAAILALLAASAAEARPNFGSSGHRAGSDTSTARKDASAPTLIETVAALLGFSLTAKVTPVAGADATRATAAKAEECEEEARRAAAEKAAGGQRSAADASKSRTRGSEPVYLAF